MMALEQARRGAAPPEAEHADSLDVLWEEFHKTRDIAVRNELVVRYGYIVKCIALKTVGYYPYYQYMEDIVNEGLISLIDAVEKFDLTKQVKFETFASIKVRGAMIDFIRKQDCFPRRLKTMAKTLNSAEETLTQELGRAPTGREMADHLKIGLDEYEKMQSETHALNVLSFEEMVYEKGMEAISVFDQSGEAHLPEQVLAEKELRGMLVRNIGLLNEKEKTVIALYYKEQLKIKEIASVMGIGASRVSQIHSGALKKLKHSLSEYGKI